MSDSRARSSCRPASPAWPDRHRHGSIGGRRIDREPIADADLFADILRKIHRPLEFDHSLFLSCLIPRMYSICCGIGKGDAALVSVLGSEPELIREKT